GQRFRRVLDLLGESGVEMAVANLPDPTAFPVLRPAGGDVRSCRAADGTLERVHPDALVSLAVEAGTTPPCAAVLSPEARGRASATVRAYNAEIPAAIDAFEARSGLRVARVDLHALFQDAAHGLDVDGDGAADLTTEFLGGLFGLDGINLTRTGQAVVANAFIAAIDDRFGAIVP